VVDCLWSCSMAYRESSMPHHPMAAGSGQVVEVSPLVSYAGEHLDELKLEGRHFTEAYDLDLQVSAPHERRGI